VLEILRAAKTTRRNPPVAETAVAGGTKPSVPKNHAAFIWSVADLLRGNYKQSEYGKVVLPLTVLRRLDCVLEPTKDKVLALHDKMSSKADNLDPILMAASGEQFFNVSKLNLTAVLSDPPNVADQLKAYIAGFSAGAREVLEKFDFTVQINRLDKANLLYLVLGKFCEIDLHPDKVSNIEMGYLYEELIRRFSELSNETAGEHFTPREVIKLMVNLLYIEDDELLTKPGIVKTLLDPACGTGGMLSVSENHLRDLNPDAELEVFGQELNAETYAICRSDMMIKGQDASHIVHGNSFTEDGHAGARFDYMLANPPFGVEWKMVAEFIKQERDKLGFAGRFGAGLPRINDGSFLFLQHMVSKMKQVEQGGSRLAIVFNGSPLFTGGAGSGESEIRRWIIENDWLEAVIALPDQLFYNTGISTYFWIVTNRKSEARKGKVQLVDARELWTKMPKSLGEKRKHMSDDQIAEITCLYGEFVEGEKVKFFRNEALGHLRITVERPLRVQWKVTEETLAVLLAEPKLTKLDEVVRARLHDEAAAWMGDRFDTDEGLRKRVLDLMKELGLKGKPLEQAIVGAFAVRDENADPIRDARGNVLPDPDLRDYENVPLPSTAVTFEADAFDRLQSLDYRTAIRDYVEAEVLPYVPDAWVDYDKTRIGYEIPLTRQFYKYVPPRPLKEIDAEIKQLEAEIQELLKEVTE
jgi:type I restriction enzyme M protein